MSLTIHAQVNVEEKIVSLYHQINSKNKEKVTEILSSFENSHDTLLQNNDLKVRIILSQFDAHYFLGNFNEALYHSLLLQSLLDPKSPDGRILTEIYYSTALIYAQFKMPLKQIEYYEKIIYDIGAPYNESKLCNATYEAVQLFGKIDKPISAIDLSRKYQASCLNSLSKDEQGLFYLNYSKLSENNLDSAIRYSYVAYTLLMSSKNLELKYTAINDYAFNLRKVGQNVKAVELINGIVPIDESKFILAIALYNNLGVSYSLLNKSIFSKVSFEKAKAIAQKNKLPTQLNAIENYLTLQDLISGDAIAARRINDKNIDQCKLQKDYKNLADAYQIQSKICLKLDDIRGSKLAETNYYAMLNSINSSKIDKRNDLEKNFQKGTELEKELLRNINNTERIAFEVLQLKLINEKLVKERQAAQREELFQKERAAQEILNQQKEIELKQRELELVKINSEKNFKEKLFLEKEKKLLTIQSIKDINAAKERIRNQKERQQSELKKKDAEAKQLVYLFAVIIFALLLLGSVFVIWRNRKQNKIIEEKNRKLEEFNSQIKEQSDRLVVKQNQITDSINYAFDIQSSIMPSINSMKRVFRDAGVMYLPKDIVSGDFYFHEEIEDFIVFGTGDCTGHGVSGSLMSLITIQAIKSAIHEKSILLPNEIIASVESEINKTLKANIHKQKDNADLTICTFNREDNTLYLASVNQPIVLIKDGSSQVIEGTQRLSGSEIKENSIRNTIVRDALGVKLIMFTDGYQDQLGYLGDRKMRYTLKKLLNELPDRYNQAHAENMLTSLEQNLINWKKDVNQLDDILVLAVEI